MRSTLAKNIYFIIFQNIGVGSIIDACLIITFWMAHTYKVMLWQKSYVMIVQSVWDCPIMVKGAQEMKFPPVNNWLLAIGFFLRRKLMDAHILRV